MRTFVTSSQCKPLHCQLCNSQATSPVQAKMHYEGKTHDKNVRNFFLSWSGNTRHVVPQKVVTSEKKAKIYENIHCNICDLQFTSETQSEQHRLGKNHFKKLVSNGAQAKSRFCNKETNQWQRSSQSDVVSIERIIFVKNLKSPSNRLDWMRSNISRKMW